MEIPWSQFAALLDGGPLYIIVLVCLYMLYSACFRKNRRSDDE